MDKLGFDSQKYLELQSAHTQGRIRQFGNKLCPESDGELFGDHHASRVLPRFEPDSKAHMLRELRDLMEVVIAICVSDIEKNRIRGGLGIAYDVDVLRFTDAFRGEGLLVGSVMITQYIGRPAAGAFRRRMEHLRVQTCLHYPIADYPHDTGLIVSDGGYGKNNYIETSHPLVVVMVPGPGSDRMAVCLSQPCHDYKRGIKAGYARLGTSPTWNLPLQHPMSLAYEAATADLGDMNMIDPFHLAAYGGTMVNYNRNVKIFPVLSATFGRVMEGCPYRFSTDMGVNMAGRCIVDDETVCAAARQEIVRCYYTALCDRRVGTTGDELVNRLELFMQRTHVDPSIRPVVVAIAQVIGETGNPVEAIELPSSEVITGKITDLMGASSITLLSVLKCLVGIDHQHHFISREAVEPIQAVRVNHLGSVSPRLHSDETLIAPAISTTTNSLAKWALDQLSVLRGCEAHPIVILSPVDSGTYNRLGLRLTREPQYEASELCHK